MDELAMLGCGRDTSGTMNMFANIMQQMQQTQQQQQKQLQAQHQHQQQQFAQMMSMMMGAFSNGQNGQGGA